jgi:hypothetical protein
MPCQPEEEGVLVEIHGSGIAEKGGNFMVSRQHKLRCMDWGTEGVCALVQFMVLLHNGTWEQYGQP